MIPFDTQKYSKIINKNLKINIDEKLANLTMSLENNVNIFKTLFKDVDTMLDRHFSNMYSKKSRYCIFFSDGITNTNIINSHIIKPLILDDTLAKHGDMPQKIKEKISWNDEIKQTRDVKEIVKSITYGDTLLLIDGYDIALLFGSKEFSLRNISEPEGERVLLGPREGFTEGILTNLSMIRRRLRTHDLKMKYLTIGTQTNTSVCIAYMDNIVNKKILEEVFKRVSGVEIDSVLDGNYIAENISERSFLGIATCGTSERPDAVVGKLMEGRIAIFVDGTPNVLCVPYLFVEYFQSSEDYYTHPIYASYNRILRFFCFFSTVFIPAVFVAVVAYHHEVLPSALMLSFSEQRSNVPLPAALECFIMLIIFDILREAGIRMPSHVGQALSIVGALVIGQAAVEADLIAAPMVIVVAFTGITILMVPKLTATSIIAKYLCLSLASMLGLAGFMTGTAIIIMHIINLHSFGIRIVTPNKDMNFQNLKDTFMRAGWPLMLNRLNPLSNNPHRKSSFKTKE